MISTHILDTSKGHPAAGVTVTLSFQQDSAASQWREISTGVTNTDGRFVFEGASAVGTYRIGFAVEEYFKREAKDYFFLDAQVIFKVQDLGRKYHVPLLLNPFGYSTYRGS